MDNLTTMHKKSPQVRAQKPLFNKEFKIREAPLTSKFDSEDGKTLYNIGIVIFIALLIYTTLDEYMKTGQSHFGLRFIYLGFNKPLLVLWVWCISNILVCISYLGLIIWAQVRTNLALKDKKIWDKLWMTVLVLHYFTFFYEIQIVRNVNFALSSATVVFLEHMRLFMKQHAFIRSNVPRILLFKKGNDNLRLPNFGKFLYFMFAPTMIYRDEYPRTQHIRWKFVFSNITQLFGMVWFSSLVSERFLFLPFHDICIRKFAVGEIVAPVLTNMVPGVVFLLLGFYTALHTFQNVFAEILLFGDRLFYKEWWRSKSFAEYNRTWNLLVQDWLYMYIYRDVYEVVVFRNKLAAKLVVFLVSAIFHEWLIANIFGFFLPINFIFFVISGALLALINVLDVKWGNLLFLYTLSFGISVETNLLAIEFFAHLNCPRNENAIDVDFPLPRFITCGCIQT